jgi:hypothetical protein
MSILASVPASSIRSAPSCWNGGVAVRQGLRFLRTELLGILATRSDVLSPRMLRLVEDLEGDWRHLDARIEGLSDEIETLARQDQHCVRLMTVCGPLLGRVQGPRCRQTRGLQALRASRI